ncbi:related to DNA repair protein Rad62 [Ustilago trichophora]|uniref:Non-structural maintenance of chromosomes element 4 n=1 Tax=Ustilago trichophora TaxID=86804 RepID=A0A5C3EBN2_9BASI|nr:related to DNA repair protein Rad62 [Ustilago trichophora]
MPRSTHHSSQEVHSQPGPSSSTPRKRPSTDSSNFIYNPRQDINDRRQVRSDYRALIAQAEESKRDSSIKPKDLLELIVKADELHERVVAPSESILDTKTLGSMSEMGARMAKKMKLHGDAFDTHEFVTRLARYLGGEAAPVRGAGRGGGGRGDDSDDDEDEDGRGGNGRNLERWDWAKLGGLAATLSTRAVTMDFLLGPLEIRPKQRRTNTQRTREEAPAERTAPRALQQTDLQNSAGRESTSQILKVAQLLSQQGPRGVCLFKFAVDPDSFVNTVENFFHVSFLIKENKASLRTDKDGNAVLGKVDPGPDGIRLPALYVVVFDSENAIAEPPSEEDGEAAGEEEEAGSKQFIMEIDYPTYLESIQLYNIERSIIPTRPNRVDPLSGREALAAAATATAAAAEEGEE